MHARTRTHTPGNSHMDMSHSSLKLQREAKSGELNMTATSIQMTFRALELE